MLALYASGVETEHGSHCRACKNALNSWTRITRVLQNTLGNKNIFPVDVVKMNEPCLWDNSEE